ncbi:hypothetical protein COLU111180_15980 [Cohnella lubricantis]|uniref:Uncharacterized protein n=1 Tax=Cohnella lubricantis TaxID=2163172 RepID=A0A841TF67_9BACL|nr:hypothetical protein [Cohnella lubricantis]MBB6679672.1 hypothetical protein [Cohnella lubricantis]MBP2119914.1 hypothetical protein [Cohnella lubricantis]
MKLRWIPVAITAVLSAALLFGGWYAYGQYGVEQPLDRVANAIPGVESADTNRSISSVELQLKLSPDADLAEVYRRVQEEGAQAIGDKTLKLKVDDSSDPALEKAWSHALFDVAEAMDHKKYSEIRTAMDQLTKQYPEIEADTQMDGTNVYIRLRSGAAVKFVILPRESEKLGVWPNA